MARKASSPKKTPLAELAVMQNGSIQSSWNKPLKRLHTFRFAKQLLGWEYVPFVKESDGIYLEPPTQGYAAISSKDKALLKILKPGTSFGPLKVGQQGCIYAGNVKLIFRFDFEKNVAKPVTKVPGYINLGQQTFFSNTAEKVALGIGAVVSALVVGAMAFGLNTIHPHPPGKLQDLPPHMLAPFVSERHLELAPEALQGSLDRFKLFASVMNYYSSLTMAMLGQKPLDPSMIFPNLTKRYVKLYEERTQDLSELQAYFAKTARSNITSKFVATLNLPAVAGESAVQELERVLDKISIQESFLKKNMDRRKQAMISFLEELPYDHGKKQAGGATQVSAEKQAALQAIAEGAVGTKSDEVLMYKEAQDAAALAWTKRQALFGDKKHESEAEESAVLVFLPLKSEIVLPTQDLESLGDDQKLSGIAASEYGVAPKKLVQKEPETGRIEPQLVESVIRKNRYQLQICYELALKKSENTAGSMEWRWKIDTLGKISELALIQSSLQDREMLRCIKDKIASWTFPRPRGGSVEIRYPFEFTPRRG